MFPLVLNFLTVNLVTLVQGPYVALDGELPVHDWVFRSPVWFVEIVCVLHVGSPEPWQGTHWDPGTAQCSPHQAERMGQYYSLRLSLSPLNIPHAFKGSGINCCCYRNGIYISLPTPIRAKIWNRWQKSQRKGFDFIPNYHLSSSIASLAPQNTIYSTRHYPNV